MPYLFLTVAVVAVAAFASVKFSLSLFACIALVTIVVKLAATYFTGPVSFGAAARSVAWACVLPALVTVAMLLTSKGQVRAEGITAILLLTVLFASFILGFKFSLGATFGASAGIAVVSTLVSGGLLYLLKPLLF
jgi:hypothetical protein